MTRSKPKGFGEESPEAREALVRKNGEEIRRMLEDNIKGPYCHWPRGEGDPGIEEHEKVVEIKYFKATDHPMFKKPGKPGFKDLVGNLGKSVQQAVQNGGVSEAIRAERLNTCANCPSFDPKFRRCQECGCFMDIKSKIGGDPSTLCPLNKWVR